MQLSDIFDFAKKLTGNSLGIPGFDMNMIQNPTDIGHFAPVTKAAGIAGAGQLGLGSGGAGMDFADVGGSGDFFGLGDAGGSAAAGGSGGFSLGNLMNLGQDGMNLFNSFNNLNNPSGGGFPYGTIAQSLLGMMGSNSVKDTLGGMFNNVLQADPWRQQMTQYQQPLLNAVTQGIGNTPYGQSIANSVARQDAAKGYNMTGNMLTDIAQGLNQGSMDYAKTLSPLAMGRAPDTTGAGLLGVGMGQAQAGLYNALGYGLQGVLDSMKGPQQPQQSGGSQGNGLSGLFNAGASVLGDIGSVFGF